MDTQPLLRANAVKSPAASFKDVPNDGDFNQQLQDQMQPRDARAASRNEVVKDTGPIVARPGHKGVEQEQQDKDVTEESEEDGIAPLDLITSVIIGMAGAPGENIEQGLPEGGNILPLSMTHTLINGLVPQEANIRAFAVDEALISNAVELPASVEKLLAQLTQASSQLNLETPADEPSLFMPSLDTDTGVEFMSAASMKLSIKSADVISDQQMVAMLQDAARSTVVSLQQVQAITGSAPANIQPYVPPQFDLGQAASVLNGGVNTPVTHPAWGERVGEQLAFMIQGKFHSADIKLNPAHLGPLEIHVSVQDDQASVRFVSTHAAVREALDAALPRLRDMLDQQGLNLANVDVSAHSGGQGAAFKQPPQHEQSAALDEASNGSTEVSTVINASIASGLSVFV